MRTTQSPRRVSILLALIAILVLCILPNLVDASPQGQRNRRQGQKKPNKNNNNNNNNNNGGGGGRGNGNNGGGGDGKGNGNGNGGNNGGNNGNGNNGGDNGNGNGNNGGNNGNGGGDTSAAVSQFCKDTGLTPSDGTQIKDGACTSTPIGALPTTANMVSSLITSPSNGATLDASSDLLVTVDYRNLDTGFFSDPAKTYYTIPQTLNSDGVIQGHSHITIQPLGSKANAAPDARTFAFFKGLNDEAQNGRTLSVTVPGGTFTEDGVYRICSMSGSNSHQPVIMPVAQRGAQDDCIRVTVEGA
ncbi:uncharacterized protein EV422DRAFT_410575 [Fimicolochytrium jonesii]|uniref:uncharacterized protein n=1 Tax=Fimicolochytrium jonesii TaxID=1396493 RepID=UPI0022FEAFBE|nr:uncharacterized protein EV422DRAFT_410575 [Fimicolochytrium jonesii]KAI8822700.1 hypothetical protein EV422DRAFT_410575 [Fimicolochytrium jonesii]